VLTWANPAPITYGTALGAEQLNATANVPGVFAYNPTANTVLSVGTNKLSVLFTPTATNDYQSVTDVVSIVVSPATVTVASGLAADNKVYDTTKIATLSSNDVVLAGVVTGDTVSLDTNGYVANFASAGVGSNITVTVTGLTLVGISANNYVLGQPTNLTASITAVSVTIASGIAANNKVYDGATTATLSSNDVVLAGVVTGDTVSLDTNGYVANFASAGVGSKIAVTVTGLTLVGISATNYALTQPADLTANIIAPSLQFVTNSPNLVISWPTNATGFTLEETASLAPPVTWTPVTNDITVDGLNYTFSTNAGFGNQFFNLVQAP
jgi:hypothetical protein